MSVCTPIQHRIEGLHHLRCLHGVRTRPDAEMHVRARQIQLRKEAVGEGRVIVLPGVDQRGLDPARRAASMIGAILGKLGRAPTIQVRCM